MPRIGPIELILILFIILVIFGVGRLPEIGGAIGKGIRAFRRSQSGEDEKDVKGAKATEEGKDTERTKA